jgi:hypothetical protein
MEMEELDGFTVSAFQRVIVEIKQRWMGDQKFIILASTNPHWAHVGGAF